MKHLLLGLLLFTATSSLNADTPAESLPKGATLASLDVQPQSIELNTPFAYSQMLVHAKLANGESVDVTRLVKFESSNLIKVSPAGVVRGVADGAGELKVSLNGQNKTIPFKISGQKAAYPVSFVQDVQPVLSKLGCNAGTCHGAQAGKNGFKLSLRGYDPIYDFRALTDDLEGRRFNRAAPERSLMLMKPAGAVPHVGGVTMTPGEPGYEIVRNWIAEGVKLDLQAPRVTSIEVFPKEITLPLPGQKQQFRVIASYADGKKRDVSQEAFIDSSNTEVATVDKTGLLISIRRGESTLLARYEGAYAASQVVVMGDRTSFSWVQRPVQNKIDELVDLKLKKLKIQASDLCTDEDFIRRVYLDLTGLPPTSEDVRKFLTNTQPSQAKRAALVDQLVGNDAYIDHWTNKWGDMLQVNRKFLGDVGANALRKWIRDGIAENKPYDKMCYEILTASGSNVQNPPASYYKILRSADAIMENTTQLFLAIRFNCNKCHDHPFEKWTQDQYYEMAAYFAQVQRSEDPKYKGQRIGGTAVEGAVPLVEQVVDAKSGDIKHDRTGAVAPPKFPYPIEGKFDNKETRRTQVAKWITSKENPYFAKSYVNRLWSYLLGVGVIEPVDDIRAGNPPTNPELLDYLTKTFVDSGFNTREVVKLICKSRTYQLSISANPWNKDDEQNYSRALPRRLPAEVLFDSIHRATGSLSKLPGLPQGARAAQLVDSNIELPGGFLELFGKPVRESACECERSNTMMLGPVLAMVNGPIVADAIRDPNSHLAKFTMANKDDAKVVEEIYLSVLNRKPITVELEAGVKALNSAKDDHQRLLSIHEKRATTLAEYQKTLDGRQAGWEAGLLAQKPTAWTVLEPSSLKASSGATFTKQPDRAVLVSGKSTTQEVYTIVADAKLKGITGLKLEALSDPSLPAKGPGRAQNGNFVLNEIRMNYRSLAKTDEKPKPVKFVNPMATVQQDQFPVANSIDNNPATGWAVANGVGNSQTAIYPIQNPIGVDGVQLTIVLDQRFGTDHTIGKFRLSVTTDKNVRLNAPVSAELIKLLEEPKEKRSKENVAKLRDMYLAQDQEYQRLVRDASNPPPSDHRVLGTQDLVWALINSPAFLFNH
jgi:hypothetical protein